HVWRGGAEERREIRTRAGFQVSADDLRPGPVGRSAFSLPRTAPEHLRPAARGFGAQPVRQLALADPGLAGDQDHAAAARQRAVEPGTQLAELGCAANENAAGWLGGRGLFGGHQRRSAATADRPAGAVASSARRFDYLRGPEARGVRRQWLPIRLPGPRRRADHLARQPGENHPEQEHVEGVGQNRQYDRMGKHRASLLTGGPLGPRVLCIWGARPRLAMLGGAAGGAW